ncbi:MAG: nucleotidyltransferase domain-containing protein [candidate division KSB1 bacterium]|nr:nucleotidyltransferase domain-containing protein [candidate division KSB1 bacterium]MDZ7303544.1 nucleotidyltransferase domain-containing protein [candidate division KSB1 bacterium]
MSEDQLAALAKVLQGYPDVQFAYLFGSQATGKVSPISDVDIAVYFGDDLPATERFQLQLLLIGVLCQTLQRNDVELAVLNNVDVVLRYQVLKYGKLFFCRDKATKNEFFVQTIREYLNTEPMRAFYREKMKQQIREGNFIGRSQRYAEAARQAARVFGAFARNREKSQGSKN